MARPEESLVAAVASVAFLWGGARGQLFLRRLHRDPIEASGDLGRFLSRWMRAPAWATELSTKSMQSRGMRFLFIFWLGLGCTAFAVAGAYVLLRVVFDS